MPSVAWIRRLRMTPERWKYAGMWLRPQTMQGKVAWSLIAHLAALYLILYGVWFGTRLLRPGTPQGTRAMVFYAPTQVAPMRSSRPPHPKRQPSKAQLPNTAVPDPEPESPPVVGANDALGNDEVSIARVQGFPLAMPELTGVGQTADVIVDVEIDENGHVTQVHQRKGIGTSVDAIMVATVEQWVFRPAMRSGKPVGSRREIHWHFDRRFNPYGCGWECFALAAN